MKKLGLGRFRIAIKLLFVKMRKSYITKGIGIILFLFPFAALLGQLPDRMTEIEWPFYRYFGINPDSQNHRKCCNLLVNFPYEIYDDLYGPDSSTEAIKASFYRIPDSCRNCPYLELQDSTITPDILTIDSLEGLFFYKLGKPGNHCKPMLTFGPSEDDLICLSCFINSTITLEPIVRCRNLRYLSIGLEGLSSLYKNNGDPDERLLNLQKLEELELGIGSAGTWPNIDWLFKLLNQLPNLHTVKVHGIFHTNLLDQLYPYKTIGAPLDLSNEWVRCAVLRWIDVEEIRIYPPHQMYTLEMLAPFAELPNLKRLYFMESFYEGSEWIAIAQQLMPNVQVQVVHGIYGNYPLFRAKVGAAEERCRNELRQKIKERAEAERIKAGGKE